MNLWPSVLGELETVRKLLDGFSIGRFGDGEFKMAHGKGYRREDANPALAEELRRMLRSPRPKCLVGIPTMNPEGAKFENWDRHRARFVTHLSSEAEYCSAFISRPDSAPWIRTREYAETMQSLWAGKRVAIVCELANSIRSVVASSAREVIHIECPSNGAYALIGEFERAVFHAAPDIAILSVGPTATVLANRLSRRMQAVDIGSAGGFLRDLLL